MTIIYAEDGPMALSAPAGSVTLVAGANGDTLQGGTGADTLLSLGYNSTLIAGSGGAVLNGTGNVLTIATATDIGGAGRDTFVFGLGYGTVTVENFQPGFDSFVINGYSSWSSLQSDGHGGTDILFADNGVADGDVLDVTGVAPSQIKPADFTFNPGPAPAGPPQITPPTGAAIAAISLTGDTTIAAGTSDVFQGPGFTLYNPSAPWAFTTLTNNGLIHAGDGVPGANVADISSALKLVNGATGVIEAVASQANDSAHLVFTSGGDESLDNAGTIDIVAADGPAGGLDGAGDFTNRAGASFTVYAGGVAATAGVATGVVFGLPSTVALSGATASFSNAGTVAITGTLAVAAKGAVNFTNSGTVTVTDNPSAVVDDGPFSQLSYGPAGVADEITQGAAVTFSNTGVITAPYAIYVNGGVYVPFAARPIFAPAVTASNAGTLNGEMVLGDGAVSLTNTGAINGAIIFGDGTDSYNGTGGTQSGGITLGRGNDTVVLGADGEVVFAQNGSGTITGGTGADFIDLGRGAYTINAGAEDTVSFALSDVGVTVNLAAGSATVGASTDTLNGVRQVIGGAGNDSLTGGPGGDTLDGGAGVNVLTGGAGANSFVLDTANVQDTITNFGAGGDQDVLRIYGFTGPQSVTQQGADTLITLSATASVLLQNVQAGSLTAGEVVYSAGPAPGATSLPAPPAPLGAEPLYLSSDLTIASGQTLTLSGHEFGIVPDGISGAQAVNVTNHGLIQASAHYWLSGMWVDLGVGTSSSTFLNADDGVFRVTNLGASVTTTFDGYIYGAAGDAVGYLASSHGPNVTNAGLWQVTAAAGGAFGLITYDPNISFLNTGQFAAAGSDTAYGVLFYNGGAFDNQGTLTASGGTSAYGVLEAEGFSGAFTNSGTITATASAGTGVGVSINAPTNEVINNSGVIRAGIALQLTLQGLGTANVNNTGLMAGDVDIVAVTANLINSGVIVGKVALSDGGGPQTATYDGQDGVVIGSVAGDGGDITITGGMGRLVVSLAVKAATASLVNQGGGTWTLSAPSVAADTLHNVQIVQFTDKAVILSAQDANAHDFNFDDHADVLIQNSAGGLAVGEAGASGQLAFAQAGGLGSEWNFIGTGDFLGDGRSDALIENGQGSVVAGEIGAGGAFAYTQIGSLGPEWSFVGDGAFLGDGKWGFLIENTAGALAVGEIGASGQETYRAIGGLGPEWKFVGSGDFLGDGKSDFLIENTAGSVYVGEVVAGGQAGYAAVTALGPEWKFVETGDFLGDGRSDFLIENTSGAVYAGEIGAGGAVAFTAITALGPEWSFVGAGDYLAEGHDQFMVRNTSGALFIGDFTGGQIHFTAAGGLGSEWKFHG